MNFMSMTKKRHFLVAVAVVGCVLFLIALHGPKSTHHGLPAESAGSDVQQHPPRGLLQASHRPLHASDDEDDPVGEVVAVTPSPSPVPRHATTETVPLSAEDSAPPPEEDPAEAQEKAETLAKLIRRGWQSQLELERALEILRRTDEMLTQAGRDYFLTDGSLLGYCRHDGGFTPWDDDMDIMTSRDNMEWLLSEEGRRQITAHGLALKMLGSGKYHKLYLAGEDIPRAGDCSWGYPFLDVFPYDLNTTTGLIDVHSSSSKLPSIYLPPLRVTFHPLVPQGLLVPNQAGLLLDMLFPGWRTTCKMEGYNHRLEEGDDSHEGDCKELAKLLGVKLAPPQRCPSASMHTL